MLADDVLHSNVSRDVKISVEARSNAFNLKCLSVLCGFTLLSAICNYIGIFSVDHLTMRIAVVVSGTTLFVPITLWFAHDRLLKRSPSILSWDGFYTELP